MFIHNHAETKSIFLSDANCLANKLAGAMLRIFLDIKFNICIILLFYYYKYYYCSST